MTQQTGNDKEEPMIWFGGEWIPARDAWAKMETATVVVEHIQRFNEMFPQLSSSDTRAVVPLVKQRLKDVELRMPSGPAELPDLGPVAADLLRKMAPEEVLDTLEEQHGTNLELQQLIQLAGEAAYLDSLRREAGEYQDNLISNDQTAQLWNDFGRPAPGGGLWSAKKVDALMKATD